LILFGTIFGVISSPLSSLSVIAGLVSYSFFKNIDVKSSSISLVFLLFVALQLIEIVYFMATKESLQFFPSEYFLPKRNYDGESFFRPVGLFSEANALATTFLLFGFCFYIRRLGFHLLLAAVCSIVSLSIYGVLVCAVLITLFLHTLKIHWLLKGKLLVVLIASLFYFFYSNPTFVYRAINFEADPSVKSRMGLGIFDFKFIPNGFDPNSAGAYGGNVFIFLNYSLGIFFVVYIFYLLKAFKFEFGFLLFLCTLMVSYQMYTTQLFWAMLGIYMSSLRINRQINLKIP